MRVQSQPLCGSSAVLPLLEGTPVEGSSQHRGVHQKHRAEQSYKSHNSTAPPQVEQRGSLSPSENAYAQRCVTNGTYYTSNVHEQHIGLAGFGLERSEKQIKCELGRLYKLLERSEKYQTYREKQPALTPAEVIARDAAERKEQERRKAEGLQQEKDKTVWPDFIEHAFWTALVRWPPMGRKKYMLEGTQRGRNELIQDSIYRDTGVRRDRKQISSHLQVLKSKLRAVPAVLLYMATPEDVTKRRRASSPIRACHSSHLRGCQHVQRTETSAKYECNASSPHAWPPYGGPQQDLTLRSGPDSGPLSSPFTITDFNMIVDGVGQPVHCLAEVHSNSRLDSSDIVDLASWRHEYSEFNFLRSKTEDWMSSSWKGLVCTASIDVMTKVRLNADLTIALGLYSQLDLSRYDYLECMTRFYDNGKSAFDPAFDSTNRDQKEQRTSCEYQPDPHESKGVLRIRFDAAFWVARMEKFQNMTHRDERSFRDLLQRLTAVQDIYGILPGTDKAQCLCTVLWRFQQTEHSAEVGGMKWRSISFAMCRSAVEEGWRHDAEDKINDPGDTNVHHEKVLNLPKSTPKDMTPYHQASQLPVDLAQTHVSHHSYAIGSHHERHPPSLSIDILKSIQPDSDHFDGSAATTTTDFSQQSLALPRNQGTLASNAHGNDFDFNGSHINIGGVFEPALNISGYGDFSSQSARFEGLHSLAGLEHDEFAAMGLAIGEYGQLVPVNANDLHDSSEQACDSTKPNWQHAHLISHLENAAEQYHSYLGANDHLQSTQNHGDSHGHDDYQQINPMEESVAIDLHDVDAHTNHSLWGLQELQGPFEERSASGAISGICYRKEQAHGSEFGAPDLVEGIQRGRGYQT